MITYVWFPLRPDGAISAAERMGQLTGLRFAGSLPDWNIVSRSTDETYSQVSRASDESWSTINRSI